jgi:hypothetical protein
MEESTMRISWVCDVPVLLQLGAEGCIWGWRLLLRVEAVVEGRTFRRAQAVPAWS